MSLTYIFKKIMFKKVVLILFLIILLLLISSIVLHFKMTGFQFYWTSFTLMLLGFYLYPFKKNLKSKSDFLILPLIVVLIFNIINIFVMKNYDENIALINLIFGLFGLVQYYILKTNKKNET